MSGSRLRLLATRKGACPEGVEFLHDHDDAGSAWEDCRIPGWLGWAIGALGLSPEPLIAVALAAVPSGTWDSVDPAVRVGRDWLMAAADDGDSVRATIMDALRGVQLEAERRFDWVAARSARLVCYLVLWRTGDLNRGGGIVCDQLALFLADVAGDWSGDRAVGIIRSAYTTDEIRAAAASLSLTFD